MYRLIAFLLLLPVLLNAATTNQIFQHGVTWGFSNSPTYGQFASGDYWVLGPVHITNISPATVVSNVTISAVSHSVTRNGSMIDPQAKSYLTLNTEPTNGWDTLFLGTGYLFDTNRYRSSMNVATGVSPGTPLYLTTNTSLISAWSHDYVASDLRPSQRVLAVLTVVTSAPAADAFRPQPYAGDKAVGFTYSGLNLAYLLTLTVPSNTPSIASLEPYISSFIPESFNGGGSSQYVRPTTNCLENYSAYAAEKYGDALCVLNLNYTAAQKSNLVCKLVQYGIDVYGAAQNGGLWTDNGGLNTGRKASLVLAAKLTGDAGMLSYCSGSNYYLFQEDRQTFYVNETNVTTSSALYTNGTEVRWSTNAFSYWSIQQQWSGTPGSSTLNKHWERYDSSAWIGIADWGIANATYQQYNGSNLASDYRDINVRALMNNLLAMRLMGFEDEWNWPAAFDYMDRCWSIQQTNGFPPRMWGGSLPDVGSLNFWNSFPLSMFNNYWSDGGTTTYRGFSFGSGVKLIGAGSVRQ